MTVRLCALIAACLACLPLGAFAASESGTTTRVLIVTNNRSLDPTRPDLQFADDDGASYAELFAELHGADAVTLLTEFDAQTRALHPEWAQRQGPPRRDALFAAVARLSAQIYEDHAAGRKSEVVLVFAGHGDIHHGEGFIELLDGRLTAGELDQLVLARLPADRIHLVLDSCNSYFMLNPRKPGGKRWQSSPVPSRSLLERYPNLGVVLSTSAEAVTYEWSELQSGIFSHEVRSGLRGAADADGDGTVRYSELAAFIDVANKAVPNDLYRPHVFARGPSGDAQTRLVSLEGHARRLRIEAPGQRRMTLRNALGVRVLDVNKEDGTPLTLMLPPGDSGLVLTEVVAAAKPEERPVERQLSIGAAQGDFALEALAEASQSVAARGEAPVFSWLFSAPFGRIAYGASVAHVAVAAPVAPTGISRRDAERLGLHLEYAAGGARSQRFTLGLSLIAGSGVMVGSAILNSGGGPSAKYWTLGTLGGSVWLALLGGVTLARRDDQEHLFADFDALDLTTEGGRGLAVLAFERRFSEAAERSAFQRRAAGTAVALTGAAALVYSAFLFTEPYCRQCIAYVNYRPLAISNATMGFFFLGSGLYLALAYESPVERAWKFYRRDADLDGEESSGVTLVPGVDASPQGMAFSLSGVF